MRICTKYEVSMFKPVARRGVHRRHTGGGIEAKIHHVSRNHALSLFFQNGRWSRRFVSQHIIFSVLVWKKVIFCKINKPILDS